MFEIVSRVPAGQKAGAVATLVMETGTCFTVEDTCSEKLGRAVSDSDVKVIRDLYRSGMESLQGTLQAIVRTDNVQLLNCFVESMEVTDGAISDNGKPINIPVLRYAIKKSALKCVLALKRVGVNTDCVRSDLILRAVDNNHVEMMRTLLKETTAQEDQTCAQLAAKKGVAEALDTILLHKPLTRATQEKETGDGLLHLVARSEGEESLKCIDLLIDKYGLDLEKRNAKGRTPLHVAAEG